MKKSIVISEQDSIAALLENERLSNSSSTAVSFCSANLLCHGGEHSAGIDAAFVNLGKDQDGFLHANDVPGQGPLKERLVPKQKVARANHQRADRNIRVLVFQQQLVCLDVFWCCAGRAGCFHLARGSAKRASGQAEVGWST